MRRSILVALLMAGLVGCASSPLTAEQKSSIKRVSIAQVKMPDKPTIFGDRAAAAFLLGGSLGLAVQNSGSDIPAMYAQQLQKNGIDVAAQLRSDLAAQLQQRGMEVVPEGQPADAILVPEVLQYGLTGDIFSSPPVRFPQLSVRLNLQRNAGGDSLWRGHAALNLMQDAIKQMDARPIQDYLQDGQLLRQQVQKASLLVAQASTSRL